MSGVFIEGAHNPVSLSGNSGAAVQDLSDTSDASLFGHSSSTTARLPNQDYLVGC